jgi:aminoglycoside phosphotransferase (APT) family kinase protein
MSSPAQAAVTLPPDPVLPRRDDLLDDEVVGARLDELLDRARDGRTGDCSRVRAKYRMGESLRATFRVGREAGGTLVSARMFPATSAAGEFLRARDAAVGQGADPRSVVFDQVTSTVFWVFPQDRKLLGLGRLISPPPELRSVFDTPWTQSELKAYQPERAATVRCADAHGATVGFAKLQRGDAGRRSVTLLCAARRGIAEHGILRLPETIGYLHEQHEQHEQHLALFSPAPGRPLNQLPLVAYPDAMAALGAALSVLHAQPTDGFAPFTRLDPDQLVSAGDLVCAARPDLASVTNGLVGVLLRTAPTHGPNVLLHGDLHAKNVLVHENGISLVDFDEASVGPAAAELGGVLARLWHPRPRDGIDPDTAQAAAETLLAAYDRRPSRADLLWYAAAALLVERAVRAISRVDAAAISDLERVLLTALRWAGPRGADRR